MRNAYDPRPVTDPTQAQVTEAQANPRTAGCGCAGLVPGAILPGSTSTHSSKPVVHSLVATLFREHDGKLFMALVPSCQAGHNARAYGWARPGVAITCLRCTC